MVKRVKRVKKGKRGKRGKKGLQGSNLSSGATYMWGPPHKLPKTVRFLKKFNQISSAPGPGPFSCVFFFGPLGLHFLSCWSSGS